MARGSSGRIVVAVDPALKRELYSALAAEGFSLKDWFIKGATQYISERKRLALPISADLPKTRKNHGKQGKRNFGS